MKKIILFFALLYINLLSSIELNQQNSSEQEIRINFAKKSELLREIYQLKLAQLVQKLQFNRLKFLSEYVEVFKMMSAWKRDYLMDYLFKNTPEVRREIQKINNFMDFCENRMPWHQVVLLSTIEEAKKQNRYLYLSKDAQAVYSGLLPEIKNIVREYIIFNNESPLTLRAWADFWKDVFLKRDSEFRSLIFDDKIFNEISKQLNS